MREYYKDDWCTIYHGDCKDILPRLDPVDLLLTDPPYGIGEKMKGGTWGFTQQYVDMRKWDVVPELEVLNACNLKAKYQIVWGGNYFCMPASRCWLVWDKSNAVPTMADCELAWTNFDKPVKRFYGQVAKHNYGHPTEKPLNLIKWCINQTPEHCETILDAFMGSGTTLRAAKDLNRKAIGIEIEEKYCEIAAMRLQQEVLDLR